MDRKSPKSYVMTRALPMKLPEDFAWVQSTPEDDWHGARLELDGQAIVEIQPCRSGWLVTVLLPDPDNPQANVAVRSVAAGMRWSARWARSRIGRLRSLVAASHPDAVSTLPRAPPASRTRQIFGA